MSDTYGAMPVGYCALRNCDEDGVYPEIGDYVVLYAKSSVIGHSRIGNNVVIGAHAAVINTDIPGGAG